MEPRIMNISPNTTETLAVYGNDAGRTYDEPVLCWALLTTGEVVGMVRDCTDTAHKLTLAQADLDIGWSFYGYESAHNRKQVDGQDT